MAVVPPFVPVTPDTLGGNNDIPSWFQIFLRQYNTFGIAISNAINGALVLESNIVGMYYPATGFAKLTTGPKYSSGGFTPITFAWLGYQYKSPSIVQVGQCQQQNGALGTNGPVGIPPGGWSYSSTTRAITINYITGLSDSTAYYINFQAT